MIRNPRTSALLLKAGSGANIRLSSADREFLTDLAKARLIAEDVASQVHYSKRKCGAQVTLKRLEQANIIKRLVIGAPRGQKPIVAWQFASHSVAKAWGGDLPGIGGNRSAFHELLVARAYFEQGRPESFRMASQFTVQDRQLFGGTEPDAMVTKENGDIIFVEADSGHYTKKQIMQKQMAWSGVKQFWIQPKIAMARVPLSDAVSLTRV